MKHTCLDCHAFALWDGDWCCTWNMKILSYCRDFPRDYEATTPDYILENDCKDYRYNESKRHNEIQKELWNRCNPNKQV